MKTKTREEEQRELDRRLREAEIMREHYQWVQRRSLGGYAGFWKAGPFVARVLGFRPGVRWPRWWFWPLTLLGGSAVVLGVGWLLNLIG